MSSTQGWFGETYCELRINERLEHRATIVRMQATLSGQPTDAVQEEAKDATPGPAGKAADGPVTARNIDRPAPPKAALPVAKPLVKALGSESPANKLDLAKRLEAQNDRVAAIIAYELLIEKFPLTSQADEARIRLKKLNGE